MSIADALSLASRYQAEGNLPLAEQVAWSVVNEQPNHADALQLLGLIHHQKGNSADAIDYLNRSLLCNRKNALTWHYLANTLRSQEKWAEAAHAAGEAFALDPNDAVIAYSLGTVLQDLGQHERAVECYQRALVLKPEFAKAANNLAHAFKELGLLDQAIAQFQETLKLCPDYAPAYYNLSEFVAVGRYHFTTGELARIEAIRTSERYSAYERSVCAFALATVRNKEGRYDEAFTYYQEANDLRKRLLRERNADYDGQSHEALVDRVIAAYDRSYFARVREWGVTTDLPVFIVGMPRSGSTLVEQILASHPQVFGAGETGEVPRFISDFAFEAAGVPYARPVVTDPSAARSLATDYLERIWRLGNGAARVTIKTLENYLHLGVIVTLFPNARIIHCRRDPLDVCVSCYFQNFKNLNFAWSLQDIGVFHRAYTKLMDHWSRALPVAIHDVHYEELIQDQEKVTRRLLDFCGLEWDERCLAFFQTRRVVCTASTVQVRKPISSRAIGRWKHYRAHLQPLFQALGRDGVTDTALSLGTIREPQRSA
jgi:tetratricopeptide (TPR) repeat protein